MAKVSKPESDPAADPKESSVEPETNPSVDKSERLKGEGSQTMTMRELLNDLKEEEENGKGANGVAFSQVSSQQFSQNDSSMVNNITGVDEEVVLARKFLPLLLKGFCFFHQITVALLLICTSVTWYKRA